MWSQRFFQVDVFAGPTGGDGRQHVPVGLRGHDHRVDVLVLHQLAVVMIGGHLFATGLLTDLGPVFRVYVADGDNPCAG